MHIRISLEVANDSAWFPLLDVIYKITIGRHSFSANHIPELFKSDWIKSRPRMVAEEIRLYSQSASNDDHRDKFGIIIDCNAKRGGKILDNATTIHPLDAIQFLVMPHQIILENEEFDGAFLLWMARALNYKRFCDAYREGRFVFRHAGGKSSIIRSARVFNDGVWGRADGKHSKRANHWISIVLDNDSRFPGDNPNEHIFQEACKIAGFVHQLDQRSIESYIPKEKLIKFDSSGIFRKKVESFFSLTLDQRKCFHMKRGFRATKNGPALSYKQFMSNTNIPQKEKDLFRSVDMKIWDDIKDGLGKNLSEIFVQEEHRPSWGDSDLSIEIHRTEILIVLQTIYSRI